MHEISKKLDRLNSKLDRLNGKLNQYNKLINKWEKDYWPTIISVKWALQHYKDYHCPCKTIGEETEMHVDKVTEAIIIKLEEFLKGKEIY